MSAIQVKAGDMIPLRFQLHDYATDKIVRVLLYDLNGNQLYSEFALSHIGNGLYVNSNKPMPEQTVIASYRIYEGDGVTLDKYGTAEDTFYLPSDHDYLTLEQLRRELMLYRVADVEVRAVADDYCINIEPNIVMVGIDDVPEIVMSALTLPVIATIINSEAVTIRVEGE